MLALYPAAAGSQSVLCDRVRHLACSWLLLCLAVILPSASWSCSGPQPGSAPSVSPSDAGLPDSTAPAAPAACTKPHALSSAILHSSPIPSGAGLADNHTLAAPAARAKAPAQKAPARWSIVGPSRGFTGKAQQQQQPQTAAAAEPATSQAAAPQPMLARRARAALVSGASGAAPTKKPAYSGDASSEL